MPLIVAIGILFVIAGVFYLGRFLYNKRKGDAEDNDGLNSKISTRLSSLDAFRGLTMLLMIFVNWGAGLFDLFTLQLLIIFLLNRRIS